MARNSWQRVVTEGDVTSVFEIKKLKTVSTEEYQKRLVGHYIPLFTEHFLPENCRWHAKFKKYNLYCLVEKPALREITYTDTEGVNQTFKIGMPYVIFLLRFKLAALDRVFVGFTRESPRNIAATEICYPPVHNIYDDLALCTGSYRYAGGDLAAKCRSLVDFFWNSTYNTDISGLVESALPEEIGIIKNDIPRAERNNDNYVNIYRSWEKLTLDKDPINIEWKKFKPFKEWVSELLGTSL